MNFGARGDGALILVALRREMQAACSNIDVCFALRTNRLHSAPEPEAHNARDHTAQAQHEHRCGQERLPHRLTCLGLCQEFVAGIEIVGNAARPVVAAKVSQEVPLQLLLAVLVEGIFRIRPIDEHGIVPLRHAQQRDDAIPAFPVAQAAVVVELSGRQIDVLVAVFGVVVHQGEIDCAVVALGDGFGAGLQLLPCFVREQIAEVKYILHWGAALFHGRRRLRAHFGVVIRRGGFQEVVRDGIRHGVHGLGKRRSAHGHVLAVPRPRRHIWLHGVADGFRQRLTAAPRFAEVGVNAPAALRHGVGAVLRRLQQQGQRRALLVVAIAIAVAIVDTCGSFLDAVEAHLRDDIHPQVDAEALGKLRERLLPLCGESLGAQRLRLIIDHAVLHRRHGRCAERQRQKQRQKRQT